MNPSTRILVNTLATYGRSVLSILLNLFSARWVLGALGQNDFGLYGVVGSLILLINFLNGGMSIGVARFYAFSIGQGHNLSESQAIDDQNRWFNTALSIHLLLPILLISVGWPVGEYAIRHWLTIPPDRIQASLWVLRISLITTSVTLLSVPFTAMYNAHQLITELAFFDVLRSVGTFALAWCLFYVQSDRLIAYAVFMMAVHVGTIFIQIVRASLKFKACRVRCNYMLNRAYMRRLFSYAGWKTLGTSCVVMRGQGIPILVNLYFGPAINASYAVAHRLSTQTISFSTALLHAFQPAVVSAEGKGNRTAMLELAIQVCKFGSLLVLLFAIPLIIEVDTLLVLWLQSPPEYSGVLCQWMLAMLIVDKMTSGHMLAVNAYGKIATYEIIQGTLLFMALPASWLLFELDMGPTALGYALFGTMALYCGGRLFFAKSLVQLSIRIWLRQVGVPVAILIAAAGATGHAIAQLYPAGFIRLCITTAACSIVTISLAWPVLLKKSEQDFVTDILRRLTKRSGGKAEPTEFNS